MNRIKFGLVGFVVLASTLVQAGELKFSIAPGFFEEKPGGKLLGPCHGGGVIGKKGNMYVTTDTERGIAGFSPAGKFVRAVGPHGVHGLEFRVGKGKECFYAARPNDHDV